MKKTKVLLPILGIGAIGASLTPIVAMTSCSNKIATVSDVIQTWTDFDGAIHLSGFKPGVTDKQIQQAFGDTLTIPKDIQYIDQYAFFNKETLKSSIPDFIKHFRFEDEYKCTKIDSYAFFGAPFETVEITCNRLDGLAPAESEDFAYSQPTNPANCWGLNTLGFMSFFGQRNLKYVKLAGSISNIEKKEVFGYEKAWVFGTSKTGDWPTDADDVQCNIDTIDFSDYYLIGSKADPRPNANLGEVFCLDYKTVVEEEEAYKHKVLIRAYNGADGAIDMGLEKMNKYREWFGLDPASQYNASALTMDPDRQGANIWKFDYAGMNANHYDTFSDLEIGEIEGLSTNLLAASFISMNQVYDYPELTEYLKPYYQFDMSKWEGSFGKTWRINMCSSTATAKINPSQLIVTLDGEVLTAGEDYVLEEEQTIKLSRELTKDSKLEVRFYADNRYDNARIVLAKAE